MIRTGGEYRESLRNGREAYRDGERVENVSTHPQFKPMIDVRARIYDLQHNKMISVALFVQSPPFGHLAADLSDNVIADKTKVV